MLILIANNSQLLIKWEVWLQVIKWWHKAHICVSSFSKFFLECCPKPVFILRSELRTSLEEHQSALELIMTKYREQVFRLLMASKRDDPAIVSQLKEQHTTVSDAQNILFYFYLLPWFFLLIVNLKNFFTASKNRFNVFQAPSVFALEYIQFTFLQEMQAHIDKINEMASVMRKAIEVDEGRICEDEERIKQLEVKKSSSHSPRFPPNNLKTDRKVP